MTRTSTKKPIIKRFFDKIIDLSLAPLFCEQLAFLIQRFVVDHLHVIGDIYDRGPAPDKIIDRLMALPSLDIQLGNHDIFVDRGVTAVLFPCLAKYHTDRCTVWKFSIVERRLWHRPL